MFRAAQLALRHAARLWDVSMATTTHASRCSVGVLSADRPGWALEGLAARYLIADEELPTQPIVVGGRCLHVFRAEQQPHDATDLKLADLRWQEVAEVSIVSLCRSWLSDCCRPHRPSFGTFVTA